MKHLTTFLIPNIVYNSQIKPLILKQYAHYSELILNLHDMYPKAKQLNYNNNLIKTKQ